MLQTRVSLKIKVAFLSNPRGLSYSFESFPHPFTFLVFHAVILNVVKKELQKVLPYFIPAFQPPEIVASFPKGYFLF